MSGLRVTLEAGGAPLPTRAPHPAKRSVAAGSGEPFCVINGRFYGQAVTGVQRYGREIVRALEPLLADRGTWASLALPRGTKLPATGRTIAALPHRGLAGHAWEQAALPFAGPAPLLNLCNTGPLLRQRQIVCLHDANVFTTPGSYRRGFRLFYRILHPLLARRAACVTTVSEASADALARHLGLERHRIAVMPNGHEHALLWRADPAALRRAGVRRPFVLLLGSRARHKNMGLLLRLAPSLDALGLDLVVTGAAATVFADDAPEAGPKRNVHWLGSVSDDELAGLLEQALCLAFPSWTEGFGLPVVEAMARGCPVIASDRASLPEICGGAALMAPPDDSAAWLSAITRLRHAPVLRADLAGLGAEQARRFSWTESAARYLDLLGRLS